MQDDTMVTLKSHGWTLVVDGDCGGSGGVGRGGTSHYQRPNKDFVYLYFIYNNVCCWLFF